MSYSFHQAVQLAQPYTETMNSSMSSPTAPSTSSSPWVYDVFLSFRGEDTRNTFTAHLYDALVGKGLYTYKDEDKLKRGDEIPPALLQAIEGSRISVTVLSEKYALSTWCLDELLKILQCKESKQQRVLPIFYHVDPSDIRHQRESFEKALAKHAEKLNGDMKKLQMWKNALQEVANLSGYHLTNGNESEFIEQIVQGVSRMANEHLYLHVAKHPVGLKPHVEAVNSHLNVGENDVRKVAIFGIAGIGKTTLAKAIYNSIMFRFEASCFLSDVSGSSTCLAKLQEALLFKIFGDCRSLKVDNIDAGINIIKRRLPSKRVLLILDGVDDQEQLDKLAGAHDWFGKGSRILITTTSQSLLQTTRGVDSTYKMTGLNQDHAIQLFCWHAFNKEKPVDGYENLVEQIIDYAERIPLVLTILGSDLHGRSQNEWKCALDQYKEIPDQKLQNKLRPIYDQLDPNEKNIFLDIACFFTGNAFGDVIRKLDSFGFHPEVWIPRLEEKCLISNFGGKLQMDDLLRDIGREVVRQESPNNPGKRSRLFIYDDICEVLEEATGTINIEAIMIDLPEDNHKNIHLSPKAFKKMKRLRFFKCNNVHFSGDHLDYLPRGIKVLEWPKCPLQSMPSTFRGDELVILRMPQSLMREISWESKNLTVMNFEECEFLTKISDLSRCPNLKEINLEFCSNLVEVHDSVGFLDKLVKLNFLGCNNLKSFPRILRLRSLVVLKLEGCSSLQDFPKIECEMEHLSQVFLNGTAIELSSSIEYFTGLEYLWLDRCINLKHIPSSILKLRSLKWLALDDCPNIISFGMEKDMHSGQSLPYIVCSSENHASSSAELLSLPPYEQFYSMITLNYTNSRLSKSSFFGPFPFFHKLEHLDLSGSDVVSIPASIKTFASLGSLALCDCKQLREIIEFPPTLVKLVASGCISLEILPEISKIFCSPRLGRWIDLSRCYKVNLGIKYMPNPTWNRVGIIYPGNKIPDWFGHCRETSNSHWCEFDIKGPPPYLEDIIGIAFCAVIEPVRTFIDLHVDMPGEDISGLCDIIYFDEMDLDHIWFWYVPTVKNISSRQAESVEAENLKITFLSSRNSVILKRCGVHLLYKHHEQNTKYHAGTVPYDENVRNLVNPMDGSHFSNRRHVDFDDDDDDSYIESNLYPQQRRITMMARKIGKLETGGNV